MLLLIWCTFLVSLATFELPHVSSLLRASYATRRSHTSLRYENVDNKAEFAKMFEKYDGLAIDRYYNARMMDVVSRVIEVGSPLVGWWILKKYDNITSIFRTDRENKLRINDRAEDLKDAIVQGGSITFIKSGQALSLRPDLVKKPEYVRQLQKLQDEVGTFPNEIAFDIMKSELGLDPHQVYSFDPLTPVASASIGQVYKATIRATNQLVAVKVQRPDALLTAPADLYILRRVAAYLKRTRKLRSDLVAIADEFGSQLWQELNYTQEAQNCLRFKALYGSIEGIHVPGVVPTLTTRRVLTQDWVDGRKGPWLRGGEQMLTIGLQCSVLQLLGRGYFHGDPHLGNLLMTESGQLAYLDFGMMCEIPAARRYALIGTVLGLVNKDIPLVITSLRSLELLPSNTNVTAVVSALESAVAKATRGGSNSGSSLNFTSLNQNLETMSSTGLLPFSLPPFYTLIIRSLTILEGLALGVDPSFRLIKGAYPFIARQILENPEPEMQSLLKSVLVNPAGRIRWDRLEQFITISANAGRVVAGDYSALKAAQSRADLVKKYAGDEEKVEVSYEMAVNVLDFLLSSNGEFLREPLINEVVDTIDALGLAGQSLASYLSNGLLPGPSQRPDRERVEQFVGLLKNIIGTGMGGTGMGGTVRSQDGFRVDNIATLSSMADTLGSLLQQESIQKIEPLIDKLSVLMRPVASRLAARSARRMVQNTLSPSNIEKTLPLVSRILDLVSMRR